MKCFIGVFGSSGLRPRITCGWLTHGIHVVCAPRAIQNLIAVSAPRAGDFSLLVQREVTKRKHARVAHRAHTARSPARLAAAGRSPNSPGANNAPRARSKVSRRLPALLGARFATREVSNPPKALVRSFFDPPWSSRASREAEAQARRGERGIANVRIRRREAPYAHPLRRMRREGTGEAGADQGACFLSVTFLCTSKER